MTSTSKTIRVLFVIPAFYRNGAISLYISLAQELATTHNATVEILATRKLAVQSHLPKAPVKVTILEKQSKITRLPKLFGRIMRSSKQADIVILTWEKGLFLPTLAARILRKPMLAIVQNNIQKAALNYPKRKGGQRFRRWAYAYAKAVICASQTLKTSVEPDVDKEKIIAISNGIDLARVKALSTEKSSLPFLLNDLPFIVGIGRLSAQKGFDVLIQAHAEVQQQGYQHRLVLVGEGDDLADLSALAQRLDVEESVVFVGFLDNPYPVMAQASLFCLSSRYEGFGLVVAEAAALGVPTIATDCVSGPCEILDNGKYGDLVEPDSARDLATAIQNHLQNPQRLKIKAQASAEQAERFSLKTCAHQYSEVIRHYAL